MPDEPVIVELTAAHIIDGLLKSHTGADRAEIVGALLAWIRILLDDCDAKTRTDAAVKMFCVAAWLAPDENFDGAALQVVREPLDQWNARHQ